MDTTHCEPTSHSVHRACHLRTLACHHEQPFLQLAGLHIPRMLVTLAGHINLPTPKGHAALAVAPHGQQCQCSNHCLESHILPPCCCPAKITKRCRSQHINNAAPLQQSCSTVAMVTPTALLSEHGAILWHTMYSRTCAPQTHSNTA